MEPDFDKRVSNKIRETEQRPVRWNKQAVWKALESQTLTRRRYHLLYTVAAAVVLLLAYFATDLATDTKNEALIMGLKSSPQQQVSSATRPVIAEDAPDTLSKDTLINNETAWGASEKAEDSTQPPQRESIRLEAVIEPIRVEVIDVPVAEAIPVMTPVKEPVTPREKTSRREKIRPIVGVITDATSPNVAKAKTPRFKLKSPEKPPDPVPWHNPRNPLVFAVNK